MRTFPSRINSFVVVLVVLVGSFFIVPPTNIVRAITTITQMGADIDGEATYDFSGTVAMSSDGTRIAISAPYNDGNGVDSGHVRVYTWNGTTWTQTGADIDGEAAGLYTGLSIEMSSDGNRIAIGTERNVGSGVETGRVRVYTWDGTTWTQTGADINGEAAGDRSGWPTAMSSDGNRIAISAPRNDGNGANSGHVRVYTWDGTTWTQTGADINGEAAGDYSSSVEMSSDGNRIAIGAELNDGNGVDTGHVRVYTWDGTTWTQTGADIDGEVANDRSGSSIAMSSDGNRVAIGAGLNDGNGVDSGHVRIYNWNGTTWTQLGNDIDGEAVNDYSGSKLAMSSDGTHIAIGASRNDGSAVDAGQVRVYILPDAPTTPTTSTTVAPTNSTTTTTVAPNNSATNSSAVGIAPTLAIISALPQTSTPFITQKTLTSGAEITITRGGFTPGENVQLVVASTPRVLATAQANAQGIVTVTGSLPRNLEVGQHTLAVYAPVSKIGFRQTIVVSASILPATGSTGTSNYVANALWLIVLGTGLVAIRRRITR